MAQIQEQLEQAGLIDADLSDAARRKLSALMTEEDVQDLVAPKAKATASTRMFGGDCTRHAPPR